MIETMALHCDVTALTHKQKSALHLAADYGNVSVVEWLLTHGIDIYQEDDSGKTALFYAQDQGHKEVAAILRRHLPQDQLQVEMRAHESTMLMLFV